MGTITQQNENRLQPKTITISADKKKSIVKLLSVVAVFSTLALFTFLSLTNDNLFLKEILIGGSIVMIISLLRFRFED